jgi:catechol 2,3-dioxygenase-like lactoylglutathione lyase family enzyme
MFSHVSFISIPTRDPERARDFYRDKLGLEVAEDAPYGESRWILMAIPGARTLVHFDPGGAAPDGGKPVLPLIAPDVAGTVAALRARGVTVTREPGPAEWDPETTYAMIRDSEDNPVLVASK